MSKPSSTPDQVHEEHSHHGCAACDPEIVDCLKCKADGVQAQADYNAGHLPELSAARASYDKTRADYREARHGLALDVQDLRHQIKQLIERVKCLIKQDHVVDCLDEAYDTVANQLDTCGGTEGCCVDDDCEFRVDLDGIPPDEVDEVLARWVTDYQKRVDAAKACYNELTQEPGRITTRVAALKTEVAGIAKDLVGDPAKTDLKELYARALVARRHVHEVWLGFEHTSAFVECLCRALTCWSKGSSAIAVLVGRQAVRHCREQARKARCDYLAEHTVKEILAVYDKICSHHHHHCAEDRDETATESD